MAITDHRWRSVAALLAIGSGAWLSACGADSGIEPGPDEDDTFLPTGPQSPDALAAVSGAAASSLEPGCATALCCPAGLTVVEGTTAPDLLSGGVASQCLVGLAGGDTITAGSAGDFVVAGDGDDTVQGGAGVDVSHGGPGIDTIYGDAQADELHGGDGDDSLWGGAGDDLLRGDEGDDTLEGEDDDDELRGGRGSDILDGGAGHDLLWAGPGSDTVDGGAGDDVIRIGGPCEIVSGESVDGGPGNDTLESPYSALKLAAMGVVVSNVETFTIIPLSTEECLDTTDDWGAVLPPTSDTAYGRVIGTSGGGALGQTHGTIEAISATGSILAVRSGEHLAIDPTGAGFLAGSSGLATVFDAQGSTRYKLRIPNDDYYAKPFPGGDHVFVGLIAREHDAAAVTGFEVYDQFGSLRSSVTTPGLGVSHLADDHLLYSDPTHLRKLDLDGVEQWAAPVALRTFAATHSGPVRVLGVQQQTGSTLVHLEESVVVGTTQIPGGVWNVAMAPSGVYSAANTQQALYIYENGQVIATRELPLAYGKSLSINDQGEVLVSGVDASDIGRVLALHPDGHIQWETTLAVDRNAWRPAVSFDASGDAFVINTESGAHHRAIVRSLP